MTYIPEISQAFTTADQSKTTTDKGKTLGQKDFLTLLVAQMQNQDPLNPTDSTEWTAQLAQYSQLEQSMNLNTAMDKLVEGQQNAERLSALSLMGKEAVVEGASFELGQEGPAQIGYRVNGTASAVTLHIQDSGGNEVATIPTSELGTGNHFLSWQGLAPDGTHFPSGSYKIVVEAQSDSPDGTVGVSPLVRTEVTGVDLGDNGAKIFTGVGEFSLANIYGVYDKNQSPTGTNENSSPVNETTAATDGPNTTKQTTAVLEAGAQATASALGG